MRFEISRFQQVGDIKNSWNHYIYKARNLLTQDFWRDQVLRIWKVGHPYQTLVTQGAPNLINTIVFTLLAQFLSAIFGFDIWREGPPKSYFWLPVHLFEGWPVASSSNDSYHFVYGRPTLIKILVILYKDGQLWWGYSSFCKGMSSSTRILIILCRGSQLVSRPVRHQAARQPASQPASSAS